MRPITVPVLHGHDHDLSGLDSIADQIGESPEQCGPGRCMDDAVEMGIALNPVHNIAECTEESAAQRGALLLVVHESRVNIIPCLRKVDDREAHLGRPR